MRIVLYFGFNLNGFDSILKIPLLFASISRKWLKKMLSPTPFSLFCALLLCFPLAIIFSTTTTTTTIISSAAVDCANETRIVGGGEIPVRVRPLEALVLPSAKASQKPRRNLTTTTTKATHKPHLNFTTTTNTTLKPHRNFTTTTNTTQKPHRNFTATANFSSNATAYGEKKDYYYDREDMELFMLAGYSGRDKPDPDKWKNKKKKVAFMFLTTSPLPFSPLWEAFFSHAPRDQYNIYVHADPRFNYTPPFAGVFSGRVIPSKPTNRHTPTLIAAARRLLSRALLHDDANYMFALLSPACIPVRSFTFMYDFLSKSNRSFIEILEHEPGAWYRWAARGSRAMLPELKFEDFRIGSQFFILNRNHALAVVRDVKLWSKFRLPCLRSHIGGCFPEEHYFPSLLNMVDPTGVIPASLTAVDWRNSSGGHPRLYKAEEAARGDMIRRMRNRRPRYGGAWINGTNSWVGRHDPFLFARKFAPDALWPLMSIAEEVLFKD